MSITPYLASAGSQNKYIISLLSVELTNLKVLNKKLWHVKKLKEKLKTTDTQTTKSLHTQFPYMMGPAHSELSEQGSEL